MDIILKRGIRMVLLFGGSTFWVPVVLEVFVVLVASEVPVVFVVLEAFVVLVVSVVLEAFVALVVSVVLVVFVEPVVFVETVRQTFWSSLLYVLRSISNVCVFRVNT